MKKLKQPQIILIVIVAIAVIAMASISIRYRNLSQKEAEILAMDTITRFDHHEIPGIYYWKTVLTLDSVERDYLRENKVDRAYVRFFDIIEDKTPLASDEVIPNATLQVKDSLPVFEIIPTVYITDNAIRRMKGRESHWARKIVKRVDNMCSYNGFKRVNEIQLDCDWTASTDSIYFKVCKYVKEWMVKDRMVREDENAVVSSTIRLHQLSQSPPPVDYGVLMLYNTGSFKNPQTKNSILSLSDVMPYIKGLRQYPLHLDFAYPSYQWNLLFRNNSFYGIMRDDIPSSITEQVDETRFKVARDTIIGNTLLKEGDVIRCESANPETVAKVRELIESKMKNRQHSDILYHLDSKNLK